MNIWNQWLSDFRIYLENVLNSPENTIIAYTRDCVQFIDFIEKYYPCVYKTGDISEVEAKAFKDKLEEKGYKKITCARKLDSLRKFGEFLKNGGLRKGVNPFYRIPYPKPERDRIDYLTIKEIDILLSMDFRNDFIGLRDNALLELFYRTGFRLSELANLKRHEVKLKDGLILICKKKDEIRKFPGGPKTFEAVTKYLEARKKKIPSSRIKSRNNTFFLNNSGYTITPRSIARIVSKYLKEVAERQKLSTHSLRSSFTTHLLDAGLTIKRVQSILRHKDCMITYKYKWYKKNYENKKSNKNKSN
ncbi:MAG: tyrosine-type recombinase/integrase [Candidatus Zixiibacteriota bacterium]|nr:MAG: tyrosine-type recombinase/integrase [candidate division Zixibacteria bacterium]